MNEMELIGWFVTIAITLLGGFKLLAKPLATIVKELVEKLTKLDDSVNGLNSTLMKQECTLNSHGERITHLENTVAVHDAEIDHLKHYHGER